MTKRYYYTCPIKAAYMAKEFGVEFGSFIPAFKTHDGKPFQIGETKDKIYIAPESEAIFSNVTTISFNDDTEAAFKDGKFLFMPEIETDQN